MRVRIGDTVQRKPGTFADDGTSKSTKSLFTGRVVYIHPRGRFHVVAFGSGERPVRESFPGTERDTPEC